MVYLYTCVSYVEGRYMYVCVLPVLHVRCTHSPHRMSTHTHTHPPCTYLPRRANPYTYIIYTCVCVLEDSIYMYMWPAERKPGTSRKYWIWVTGSFIRTGRFPGKLRLLHQGVTGGLHCIILNYEARLCYYKDAISLNSQAGQWNMETHCYGQLRFQKR